MSEDPGTSRSETVGSADSVAADAVRARQRRSVRTFVLVLAAVALGLTVLNQFVGSGPACDRIPGVRTGICLTDPDDRGAAPTQSAETLTGEQVSLAEFGGQVVVVNFWAAWCGPCRAEQPVLNEAHQLVAGPDVAFLGVAIQDSLVNQKAHEDEFAIPYPSIFDPSNAYSATFGGIGARSIPTTVIIDRQGRVAVRLFGEVRNAIEIAALVELLEAEPAA